MQVNFVFDRPTKGTYRFKEVEKEGQAPKVGTLYVRKTALPGGPPAELSVLISVPTEQ